MVKIPNSLVECLAGQVISLLFTYKYSFPFTASTFTTDAFLVPLTCLVCLAYKARIFKERNIKGGLLSGGLYFAYLINIVRGSNSFCMEYTVLVFGLGFYIALLINYLISDKLESSFLQYGVYAVILVITSLIFISKSDLCGTLILVSSSQNIISLVSYVSYTVLINIFTNESGIIEYLIYSSITPIIFFALTSFPNKGLDIYPNPLIDHILYYLVSLSLHISTVVYLQIYGIVSFNAIHTSNLLIFLFLKGYERISLGGMYITLIITSLISKME